MKKFFFESEMKAPQPFPFPGGELVVFSRRSAMKDTPNEDAAALIPRDGTAGLLAVCDGVGGLPGGERASRTVIECLAEQIEKSGDSEIQLRTSILDGVEAANLRLLSEGKGSATTLVVAEIEGRSVRPYHVGDSQILITGQRGLVKLQTLSHSPIGFAQESGMIDESDALHHEDRHLVSNLVGTAEMRIEIGPSQRLALHDTLLLATDGLFDNLYNDELVEMIRKGPLMAAAERVIERVTARMSAPKAGEPSKADDLAFILYRRSR